MKIDTPNITATSPELQAIKGWAADLSYKLTQSLTEIPLPSRSSISARKTKRHC